MTSSAYKVNLPLSASPEIPRRMVLGITGSPGSGKSTVTSMLAELGAWVVDVDIAGKWTTDNVLAVRHEIRQQFGQDMFDAEGNLDRARLGTLVFQDREKLNQLNHIVHPYMLYRVRNRILTYLYHTMHPLIVVDAALLFELCLSTEMDQILTVKADLETRLERLCQRPGVDRDKAQRMTNSQQSQDDKIAKAHIVLDNSGGLSDLGEQVEIIYRQLV